MEFKRSIRVKLVTHVTLFNVNMIVRKNINQAFFLLKCDRLLSNDEQMQQQSPGRLPGFCCDLKNNGKNDVVK